MSKKRIVTIFLTFALIWVQTVSGRAAETMITAASVSGSVGETVDVPVSISGNPGASALVLWLDYDTNYLEPVSITKSELLQNGMFMDNLAAEGEKSSVNVTWADTSDITGDGPLYTISFRILKRIPSGGAIMKWNEEKSSASNEELELISCVLQGGEVTSLSQTSWYMYLPLLLVPGAIIGFFLNRRRKVT